MSLIWKILRWVVRPHRSVEQEDEQNLARLFAALSLLILFIIIPGNLPYYFDAIRPAGAERTIEFILRSIVPGFVIFSSTYVLARSRYYRAAGVVMDITIPILVLTLVALERGPGTYLLMVYFLLANVLGILVLPFAWQVIQFLSLLSITLGAAFFLPWIPLAGVLNNVFFLLLITGGSAVLIGRFIKHQEVIRLRTITNLNTQLREKIASMTALLQHMGEGVIFFDQNNRATIVNDRVKDLLQMQAGELDTAHPLNHLHFFTEKKEAVVPEKILPANSSYQKDWLLQAGENNFIPVAVNYTSIKQNGGIPGSVMVLHDSRQEYEVEEAKNMFFEVVSHEIRTPLTKIRWGLDLLAEIPEVERSQREELHAMQESIGRISEILNTMFLYSQVSSDPDLAEPSPFDLSIVLSEMQEKYQPLAYAKGLTLIVDTRSRQVHTSQRFLTLILDQYINNAIKFTEKGTIAVQIDDHTVSVNDTGKGIPESDWEKIFSSYYQQGGIIGRDQEKGGLGLGLSFVKLLANKSNLKVGFESVEGKGSRFFVQFAQS